MAFALVEVDVTRPLEELDLAAGASGVGLLLRDGRRPLGFVLMSYEDSTLPPSVVEPLAVKVGAAGLLEERVRRALLADGLGDGSPELPAGVQHSVTVAVCTRNRPDDLDRCLDSI